MRYSRCRAILMSGLWLASALGASVAFGAEARYRLALADALGGGTTYIDLSAFDNTFAGGDVGITPADVSALAREGERLHGVVRCTMEQEPCAFEIDVTVRNDEVTGAYTGTRGATRVAGAVTGTVRTTAYPPSAEHPVGYRGDGTGIFAFTEPPTTWAPGEWAPGLKNVRWRMKFDDPYPWGNAQPLVVGTRVFVFHEPTIMACLDADTGAVLWKKDMNLLWALPGDEFAKYWPMWEERGKAAEGWRKGDAAAAARLKELDAVLIPKVQFYGEGCQQKYLKGYGFATPVSDGERVYIKNGTGMLAAVDLDGNVKWARNIGYNGGHSSVASPCLIDGRLIVWNAVNNGKLHDLACYDAKTGEPLWRTEPRPAGAADGCASPVVVRLNGVPVIVAANGDVVRVADGRILAEAVHPQGFTTPPSHDDVVFFGINGVLEAVRLTLDGDRVTAAKLWSAKPRVEGNANDGAMYGAQVYYEGYVYMLQSRGQFSIVNAATGEVTCAMMAHPGRGGETYSNLSVAGGKVYGFDMNGRGLVVKAGPAGEVVARNDCMGGATGSPFFVGNRIYLRNSYRAWMPCWIYCIEDGKPDATPPV